MSEREREDTLGVGKYFLWGAMAVEETRHDHFVCNIWTWAAGSQTGGSRNFSTERNRLRKHRRYLEAYGITEMKDAEIQFSLFIFEFGAAAQEEYIY